MLNLTSAMALIPYPVRGGYGVMLARRGETYEVEPQERRRDLIIAGVAAVYTLFMIVCRWPEIRAAVGGALCAGHRALLLGTARAGQAGVHQPVGLDHLRRSRSSAAVVGIYGLATGYITI